MPLRSLFRHFLTRAAIRAPIRQWAKTYGIFTNPYSDEDIVDAYVFAHRYRVPVFKKILFQMSISDFNDITPRHSAVANAFEISQLHPHSCNCLWMQPAGTEIQVPLTLSQMPKMVMMPPHPNSICLWASSFELRKYMLNSPNLGDENSVFTKRST